MYSCSQLGIDSAALTFSWFGWVQEPDSHVTSATELERCRPLREGPASDVAGRAASAACPCSCAPSDTLGRACAWLWVRACGDERLSVLNTAGAATAGHALGCGLSPLHWSPCCDGPGPASCGRSPAEQRASSVLPEATGLSVGCSLGSGAVYWPSIEPCGTALQPAVPQVPPSRLADRAHRSLCATRVKQRGAPCRLNSGYCFRDVWQRAISASCAALD
jgi:hypothetical protein